METIARINGINRASITGSVAITMAANQAANWRTSYVDIRNTIWQSLDLESQSPAGLTH
jgi:hypothetical protein